MKVKLDDVCERGTSTLRQSDIENKNGIYPVYGAAGLIGYVDFFHQKTPYVAVVKDGAGIGRTMLLPGRSSIIGTMQYLLPKSNVLPEYRKRKVIGCEHSSTLLLIHALFPHLFIPWREAFKFSV